VGWIRWTIKGQECAVARAGGQMWATRWKDSGSREAGGRSRHPGRAAVRQIAGTRGRSRRRQAGLRNRQPAVRWEGCPASHRARGSGASGVLIGQARAVRSQVAHGAHASHPPGKPTPGRSHLPGKRQVSVPLHPRARNGKKFRASVPLHLHAHHGNRQGVQALRAPGRVVAALMNGACQPRDQKQMNGACQPRGRNHPSVARWSLPVQGE
jgi:hypothetical protein